MTLLTLVDRAPARADIPPGTSAGIVVALTPIALEACQRQGLAPLVLDDLFDRSVLLGKLEAYLAWQLDWLSRIDLELGSTGAVIAAALMLAPPVDSVVACGSALLGAALAVEASGIHYVGRGEQAQVEKEVPSNFQFDPLAGGTPLAGQLVPLLAGHLGIPFRHFSAGIESTWASPSGGRSVNLMDRLKVWSGPMVNVWRPPTRRSSSGGTLMLWAAGYGARGFAQGEHERGRRVLLMRGGEHAELMAPRVRGFAPVGPAVSLVPQGGKRKASGVHGALDLVHEVDCWTGIPGSGGLLRSRVSRLANGVVPVLDAAADLLAPQIKGQGIDLVAAANPSSIRDFAGLLAGKRAEVDRLLLQHGDQLFPYDKWLVTELQNFEHFWTSDATVVEDLVPRDGPARVGLPELSVLSPRIDQLVASGRRRSRRQGTQTPACYVPSFLFGDSHVLGGYYYDDAWYHRWHRRLLTWMGSMQADRFVWKALPGSDRDIDPIPEIIEELQISNVRYETRPFRAVAHEFGRVITDFPSTAIYEAVHLGHPVLVLAFPRFAELRNAAAAAFANVIHLCADEEEALGHLERFLGSPAIDYRVDPTTILRR